MSKEKLIPELRFPEFRNDGDWKVKTIDDLCDILNNIRKPISSSDRQKGSYPYYGASGIIDYVDDFLFDERLLLVGEDGAKWGAYENTAFLVEGKYWVNNHAHVLRPNLINDKLLESYLVKLNLLPYITGAAPPKLTLGKLKEIPIPVPDSPKEQKKIASCLSSLDEVITAHSQKLELLKDHKKGLMQNLFPQEGEKVPKYRFKEFEKDGEWIEKTIDNIKSVLTDYVANGSFQSLKENLNVLDSEDYAFYVRLTDLRAGLGHSNQKYVDESTYIFLNKSALYGGELLMANIGANVGEVWQMPLTNKPSTLAPNMLMIKFKKEFDSGYVFQFLTSNQGIKNISKAISGSGHPKISKTDLRQVKVSIPPRLEEQQKIASCLSSLDALIKAQTEIIEQLKLHKKGLMQGLFPKN